MEDFVRVAAAVPLVKPTKVGANLESVKRLLALGIDIVIGNFPDMVKRVLTK